jgi:hypothetical protein
MIFRLLGSTWAANTMSYHVLAEPSEFSPGGYGGFGAAQIFITEYEQSGKTHSGSWQFLTLDNVSKVKFTLTVQNADLQAIGCVFAR